MSCVAYTHLRALIFTQLAFSFQPSRSSSIGSNQKQPQSVSLWVHHHHHHHRWIPTSYDSLPRFLFSSPLQFSHDLPRIWCVLGVSWHPLASATKQFWFTLHHRRRGSWSKDLRLYNAVHVHVIHVAHEIFRSRFTKCNVGNSDFK